MRYQSNPLTRLLMSFIGLCQFGVFEMQVTSTLHLPLQLWYLQHLSSTLVIGDWRVVVGGGVRLQNFTQLQYRHFLYIRTFIISY